MPGRAGAAHLAAGDPDPAGARPVEPGDDAQQRRLPAARGPQDGDEVVLGDREVGGGEGLDGLGAAVAGEDPRHALDRDFETVPHQASFQGNRSRLAALNRKSETRPISPMTMMPKMIWPVASNAWLSMIMWPMPEDEPISSATMT